MYATINLPGSQHFRYHGPATRAECEAWLNEQKQSYQDRFGGAWFGAYAPARIITNKVARSWKYRDGNRVF